MQYTLRISLLVQRPIKVYFDVLVWGASLASTSCDTSKVSYRDCSFLFQSGLLRVASPLLFARMLLTKVCDIKKIGGWLRHLKYVFENWRESILGPILESIFGVGANLPYLGIADGQAEEDHTAEFLSVASTTALAVVGHLDLYSQSLLHPPWSLMLLPILPAEAQHGLVDAAKREWAAVLATECSRPGFLSKKVPLTNFQAYRECMVVVRLVERPMSNVSAGKQARQYYLFSRQADQRMVMPTFR
jgi:hypothetical protein